MKVTEVLTFRTVTISLRMITYDIDNVGNELDSGKEMMNALTMIFNLQGF